MNVDLLAAVAPVVVTIVDVRAVINGGGPKDMWMSTSTFGRLSNRFRYNSAPGGIDVQKSPAGAGLIPWGDFHAVIAAGVTPDIEHRVRQLNEQWVYHVTAAPPIGKRPDLRALDDYHAAGRALTGALNGLRDEVVARGVAALRAPADGQLELWGTA